MPTYQVYLLVPQHIHAGLSNGTLVRDAAGIIRKAPGPGGGQVVAHLKEITPHEILQSQSMLPGLIGSAVTIGCSIYICHHMDRRFDRIEAMCSRIQFAVDSALATVRNIQELQMYAFTTDILKGLEYLRRYARTHTPHFLPDAKKYLFQGGCVIRGLFKPRDGEWLLENAPDVERILYSASLCAMAEPEAIALSGDTPQDQAVAVEAHFEFWKEIHEKLLSTPGSAQRVPTTKMLRACQGAGPDAKRRDWLDGTKEMISSLEGEMIFLEAANEIGYEPLQESIHEAERTGTNNLCICYS